jgi:hypothetical protein
MPVSVLGSVAKHILEGVRASRVPAKPAAATAAPAPPGGPSMDSQYSLGNDSKPQPGVPKGELRGPYTLACEIFPGTQHRYWVYVPAQYDEATPTVRKQCCNAAGIPTLPLLAPNYYY